MPSNYFSRRKKGVPLPVVCASKQKIFIQPPPPTPPPPIMIGNLELSYVPSLTMPPSQNEGILFTLVPNTWSYVAHAIGFYFTINALIAYNWTFLSWTISMQYIYTWTDPDNTPKQRRCQLYRSNVHPDVYPGYYVRVDIGPMNTEVSSGIFQFQ